MKRAHRFSALAAALAWIFPHYCILCGEQVEESGGPCPGEGPAAGIGVLSAPICPACLTRLRGIEGPRCRICGRELYSESDVCWPCRGAEHACSEVLPLFKYRGDVASLLKAYKRSKRASLAPLWARLMETAADARWPGRTIVPVPPRPEKLARREWDQVEAIVAKMERDGYPVRRILARGSGSQQKRLNREMRKRNAEKAYSVLPSAAGRVPAAVILVDDVYTTGATVDACAAALRAAGAGSVAALVLAAD